MAAVGEQAAAVAACRRVLLGIGSTVSHSPLGCSSLAVLTCRWQAIALRMHILLGLKIVQLVASNHAESLSSSLATVTKDQELCKSSFGDLLTYRDIEVWRFKNTSHGRNAIQFEQH